MTPRSVAMIAAALLTSLYIMRWGYRWADHRRDARHGGRLLLFSFRYNGTFFLYAISAITGLGRDLRRRPPTMLHRTYADRVSTSPGFGECSPDRRGAEHRRCTSFYTRRRHVSGFRIIFLGIVAALIGVIRGFFDAEFSKGNTGRLTWILKNRVQRGARPLKSRPSAGRMKAGKP